MVAGKKSSAFATAARHSKQKTMHDDYELSSIGDVSASVRFSTNEK